MNKNTNNNRISVGSPMNFSAEASIGLPISNTRGYSYQGLKYIPYSSDAVKYRSSNNNYPQSIARMSYDSPTNGAAVLRKSMMIKGRGFNMEGLPTGLVAMFDSINRYDETINDILELVANDYALYSGFALKAIWGNNGKIVQLEHVPFEEVRCGEATEDNEINYYVISNNWDKTLTESKAITYGIPAFNPEFFGEDSIAIKNGEIELTDDQEMNASQLIYFYNRKPSATNGMRFYPVPDYVNGFDAIDTEIQIGISNKALIDNGFGGKYMITFPYEPQSEKEMNETNAKLKANFSGAANNGGVINLYASDKESLPQVDKLEPIDATTYIELERTIKQSIVTAHQIPAIILEINLSGGFNNRADEMKMAYDIFQATTIRAYQDKIARVFNRIASHMGYPDAALDIIPFTLDVESPVTKVSGEAATNTNNSN